jgi:hypothetical protein
MTKRELMSINDWDSEYANSESNHKRKTGMVKAVAGMIANWSFKKQATVGLSSTVS